MSKRVWADGLRGLHVAVLAMTLAACGGGGSSAPPTPTYTVGGTVLGLAGSGLVLKDNGGAGLPVTAAGAFTFAEAVSQGAA